MVTGCRAKSWNFGTAKAELILRDSKLLSCWSETLDIATLPEDAWRGTSQPRGVEVKLRSGISKVTMQRERETLYSSHFPLIFQAIPTSRTVKIVKKLEHLTLWVAFAQARDLPDDLLRSSLPLTRSGVPLAHLAAGESLRGCGKFSEIGCTLNWIHKPTRVGGMQKRPLVPLQILSTQWLGYTRSTVKLCLWWEKNPTEKTGVSDAFWCISGSVAASCLIYCRQKFKVFIICWSDGSAIRVSCHTKSHTKPLAFTGMLQVRTWQRASLEFVLRLRNFIEMGCRWMFDHVSPFSRAMLNETSTLQDTCRPNSLVFSWPRYWSLGSAWDATSTGCDCLLHDPIRKCTRRTLPSVMWIPYRVAA